MGMLAVNVDDPSAHTHDNSQIEKIYTYVFIYLTENTRNIERESSTSVCVWQLSDVSSGLSESWTRTEPAQSYLGFPQSTHTHTHHTGTSTSKAQHTRGRDRKRGGVGL